MDSKMEKEYSLGSFVYVDLDNGREPAPGVVISRISRMVEIATINDGRYLTATREIGGLLLQPGSQESMLRYLSDEARDLNKLYEWANNEEAVLEATTRELAHNNVSRLEVTNNLYHGAAAARRYDDIQQWIQRIEKGMEPHEAFLAPLEKPRTGYYVAMHRDMYPGYNYYEGVILGGDRFPEEFMQIKMNLHKGFRKEDEWEYKYRGWNEVIEIPDRAKKIFFLVRPSEDAIRLYISLSSEYGRDDNW